MTFVSEVLRILVPVLGAAGFQLMAATDPNEVHFASSKYDVVVYFDPQNMETDARVKPKASGAEWAHIRDVVEMDELPEDDDAPIAPRSQETVITELGHLIALLPQ